LVGGAVGPDAAPEDLREHLGGVAQQRDRDRLPVPLGSFEKGECVVEALGLDADVAGAQAELDAARPALDCETRHPGYGSGERLRAPHAAEPGLQHPAARQVAAVVVAAHLHEGLVGALHYALAADVDPRARRYLAVHHQALAIEFVELVPGGPVRHEI